MRLLNFFIVLAVGNPVKNKQRHDICYAMDLANHCKTHCFLPKISLACSIFLSGLFG